MCVLVFACPAHVTRNRQDLKYLAVEKAMIFITPLNSHKLDLSAATF